MPESCRRWSKSRWALLILFSLLLAYCVFPSKREQRPAEGYIGDIFFSFPQNQYTFAVGIKEENGRKVIYDNLWGFHLPDMKPFVQKSSAEFIDLHGPWVRANILSHRNGCTGRMIEEYLDKGRMTLRTDWIGTLPKDMINPTDLSMQESQHREFKLRKISTPNSDFYRVGTFLAPVRGGPNHPIYHGPTKIYWSDDYCTTITCTAAPPGLEERCSHDYIINNKNLIVTMMYDHAYIYLWHEIQTEATRIVQSMEKDKK